MAAYTVCFCGTGCSRDEGVKSRSWSQAGLSGSSPAAIYDSQAGYIPVRIHQDISGDLKAKNPSVTVRGVGENDWAEQSNASDPLNLTGPLKLEGDLADLAGSYTNGKDCRSMAAQATGWQAVLLALHGANLAAASGADEYNFIGHSRGAVEAIKAAWFLAAYGPPRMVKVNLFAIDPVPGTGEWYGILTTLPPNVHNYVGIYAWDHVDSRFDALVPRPPAQGTVVSKKSWKTLNVGLTSPIDPLEMSDRARPQLAPDNYKLYACRGKHGTVAGNITSDGQYSPTNTSENVATVPRLVYRIARAYLAEWGTRFAVGSRVTESARQLRKRIHTDHMEFDAMGGGASRTSRLPGPRSMRKVSSSGGLNGTPLTGQYLEDVGGDPPYTLIYPCTTGRTGAGLVKWTFL